MSRYSPQSRMNFTSAPRVSGDEPTALREVRDEDGVLPA